MAVAMEATDQVRVRLLGGFAVTRGSASIDLKPAAQRLVAFLALLERAVERRYAAYRLWPDKCDDRAMANLRSALWRIRLLPVNLVDASATHLQLEQTVWVDARHGLKPATTGGCLGDATLSGELLPDWYDDWLTVERERLRQSLLHALEAACRQAMRENRHGDAIDLGLRAVALEPLRESAHRLVIETHLREGNAYDARRQYRQLATLLHDELGLLPSVSLRGAMAQTFLRERS